MRKWLALGLLAVGIGVLGCTGDVRPAIREGEAERPVADTGYIANGTTGGDAAGTLNLDHDQRTTEPNAGGPRRGRGRRGG